MIEKIAMDEAYLERVREEMRVDMKPFLDRGFSEDEAEQMSIIYEMTDLTIDEVVKEGPNYELR